MTPSTDPTPSAPAATTEPTTEPITTRAPAAPRHTPSAPGAKRARHKRWTRIAAAVTVLGFVGFSAFLIGNWKSLFQQKTAAEMQAEGCLSFLDGLANRVRGFREFKNRMPASLAELRDPDLPSDHDAEPWDCWAKPIEYRIVDEDSGDFRLRSYGPDMLPDTADDLLWPFGRTWR